MNRSSSLHPSALRLPSAAAVLFVILATVFWAVFYASPARAEEQPVVLGEYANISAAKRFPALQEDAAKPAPQVTGKISARSAIVIDTSRDLVLYAKEPDMPRQPASTIKVLTGMIALKALSGVEDVPVSREAAGRPSSKMYLDPDKRYLADDLIRGVLLASANDASVALAELLAGSEELFARFMTAQAEIWGATQTVCKTATGLTAEGQTSTARDLALIFKQAMLEPDFAETIGKRSLETREGGKFYNHNKALWRIEGALGGKTGYTNAARQTYVGKFKRGEAEIVVAIMGSETMWYDLKHLVDFGFKQYQYISPDQDVDQAEEADLTSAAEPSPEEKEALL